MAGPKIRNAKVGDNYTLTAAAVVIAKLFATLFAVSIVSSILAGIFGAILPFDAVGGLLGFLVAVAGAVYLWAQTWPPWPPRQRLNLHDIIDEMREEERLPTPSDAARAISLLQVDATRFSAKSRKYLAIVIGQGMEKASDAERVLAQINRIEDGPEPVDASEIIGRLFNLYEAADPGPLYNRIWEKGVKYTFWKGGFAADLNHLWQVENNVIRGTTEAIKLMSILGPIGAEHRETLLGMVDSDRWDERSCAAVGLGAIGRDHPEYFVECMGQVVPLANDTEKTVREHALIGLGLLAIAESEHSEKAIKKLNEIGTEVPDPDLRAGVNDILERIEKDREMKEEVEEKMIEQIDEMAETEDSSVSTFEPAR